MRNPDFNRWLKPESSSELQTNLSSMLNVIGNSLEKEL